MPARTAQPVIRKIKKSAGCAKDKKEHSGSEAKKHKSRIAELERVLEEE